MRVAPAPRFPAHWPHGLTDRGIGARHQVRELAHLLEAREEEVLFEALVVVLDDAADDGGSGGQPVEWQRLLRSESEDGLVVDEHRLPARKSSVR